MMPGFPRVPACEAANPTTGIDHRGIYFAEARKGLDLSRRERQEGDRGEAARWLNYACRCNASIRRVAA